MPRMLQKIRVDIVCSNSDTTSRHVYKLVFFKQNEHHCHRRPAGTKKTHQIQQSLRHSGEKTNVLRGIGRLFLFSSSKRVLLGGAIFAEGCCDGSIPLHGKTCRVNLLLFFFHSKLHDVRFIGKWYLRFPLCSLCQSKVSTPSRNSCTNWKDGACGIIIFLETKRNSIKLTFPAVQRFPGRWIRPNHTGVSFLYS